jgi:hypothetical protein
MTKTYLADLAERCVWTALQAFLSVFTVTDLSTAKAAGVAAAAAVLALLKGVAARRVGDRNSAALIPALRKARRA